MIGGNPYAGAVPVIVTLADGTAKECKSTVESKWLRAFLGAACPGAVVCSECVTLPCLIRRENGAEFKGTYTPDIILEWNDFRRLYIEVKYSSIDAKMDSRQERCLHYNPRAKFAVVGGPGGPDEPFYVKLVTTGRDNKIVVREFDSVLLATLGEFIGCGFPDDEKGLSGSP